MAYCAADSPTFSKGNKHQRGTLNMSKKKRPDIPLFQTPIIETHCHLDYLDETELATTLAKSAECGIEKIITIAVSPDNLDKVLRLTRHANIWGTQGIHPHDASSYTTDIGTLIHQRMAYPKIVAVGEIGLDYYYDHGDRATQRQVFAQQLEIASQTDKPVVIHTRDADEDTRAILEDFRHRLPRKGVIHSFTSSLSLAEYCLDAGFSLGFNGITTFNNAQNVRDVVSATPVERILLETDAPYLTPAPYRGRPNAPFYLPFIAQQVATVKGLAVEELLQQAYINSHEVFFKLNRIDSNEQP